MKTVIIIPASLKSKRFPNKPLVEIHNGKTMVELVFNAANAVSPTYVATSDDEIIDKVESFAPSQSVRIHAKHNNGIYRVIEAVETLEKNNGETIDRIIYLQCDVPFFRTSILFSLRTDIMENFPVNSDVVTLCYKDDYAKATDSDNIKMIIDSANNALYFSRSMIPFISNMDFFKTSQFYPNDLFLYQIGIYGFRRETLNAIKTFKPDAFSIIEDLEQLNWLYNGLKIKCFLVNYKAKGIHNPSDLKK